MTNQKDIFSTIEGKWEFAIAIAVIALMGYFVYSTSFKDKTEEKPKVEQIDVVKKAPKAETAIATEVSNQFTSNAWVNEPPYRVSKVKRKGAIDGNVEAEASIITDYDVDKDNSSEELVGATTTAIETVKESLPEAVEKISEAIPEAVDKISEVSPTTEPTRIVEPAIVEPAEAVAEVKEQVKKTPAPRPAPKAPTASPIEKSDCNVIIGSFRNPANIQRIVDKLDEMGYPNVQGVTRPGIEYIGVPVPCDDRERQLELARLMNRTFAIKSWIRRK